MRARIIRSSSRQFECRLDDGSVVSATALANLLKSEESLVVGDFVTLRMDQDPVITHREERKSEIYRILIREAKKKITAANCDVIVIVSSVSRPTYKRGIIDRFLVRAHQWGIPSLVVFNKMDEYDEETFDLKFEADRLRLLEVRSFEVSCVEENYSPKFLTEGPTELKKLLKGKTAILLGQSGVGKSSLINHLSPIAAEQLKTKAIGKAGKGSHTTTWSEVISLGDFDLIDSPGIRSFSLDDINPNELISYFPDLESLAVQCKFNNCDHLSESKGCAFNELDPESYETELTMSRLESYRRVFEEVSSTPQWAKKV